MRPILDPQTKALFEAGYIKPVDFAFVFILAAQAAIAILMSVGGHLSILGFLVILGTSILTTLLWLLLLVYRCSFFVLMARAEINLMPENAAKLATSMQLSMSAPVGN